MRPPASRRRRPRTTISAHSIRPSFSCPAPPATAPPSSSTTATAVSTSPSAKPVEIEITGAAFTYDLEGASHAELFPAPALEGAFPGIQRILHEAHVRYVFERFGVPYVVSIQCYDRPPARRYLSCKEADPIADPLPASVAHRRRQRRCRSSRRTSTSRGRRQNRRTFTYYSPGDLIPDTGWRKLPGRADYHVYAEMRFPIANAPAYVKSQSFMPWGDCYQSGTRGPARQEGRALFLHA